MTTTVPVWLSDTGDVVVWAATISVVLFVVQYTLSSPWWRDPVGRTVVAKDCALLCLLIPAVLVMVWPGLLDPVAGEIVGVTSLALVAAAMLWRSVVWWRIRPPFFVKRGIADKPERKVYPPGEDSAL